MNNPIATPERDPRPKIQAFTGLAIYTDGTHRLVTLRAPQGADEIEVCSAYRDLNPQLAAFMPVPGYVWSGHANQAQAEALAAFERGESKFDYRERTENIINVPMMIL